MGALVPTGEVRDGVVIYRQDAPALIPTTGIAYRAPGIDPITVDQATITTAGGTAPTSIATLETMMNRLLQMKEATYNPATVGNEAADFAAQTQNYCGLYAGSPGCTPGEQAALAAKYSGMLLNYAQRTDAFNAGDRSQPGTKFTVQGGQLVPYQMKGNALEKTAPPPPASLPLPPPRNVINPPGGGSNVTEDKIANAQNNGASKDMGNEDNEGNGGGGGEMEISAWIKDNWVLIALAAGALVVLPMVMSGMKK